MPPLAFDYLGLATLITATCTGLATLITASRAGKAKQNTEQLKDTGAQLVGKVEDVQGKVENGDGVDGGSH